MAVTRRSLAKLLAGAAVVQAANAQTDPDVDSARAALKSNIEKIAKVKLPMAVEPAFHFKA